jgi:hypothetical protein
VIVVAGSYPGHARIALKSAPVGRHGTNLWNVKGELLGCENFALAIFGLLPSSD